MKFAPNIRLSFEADAEKVNVQCLMGLDFIISLGFLEL